uniref:Nuclear receptor domain-containing protein n=1 Tax=Steinernema glaseri TaxID=37863 RepID=A0A1I7YB65_9BILA
MSSEGRQECRVCSGVANGYHFGAMSCAACNAFFRRSIAEKRKYICRKDGDCEINPNARCFCRACRLKKCFLVGMDAKAVQPHRDVIGKKLKKRPPNESSPSLPNVETKEDSPQTIDNSFLLSNVTNSNSAFSIPTNSSKAISTTVFSMASVAELDPPNVLAEQLLAFSRQPVIASVSAIPSANDFLDLTPQPIRNIYASAVAQTSKASTSAQPIFNISQPQPVITHTPYNYEECRPVPQIRNRSIQHCQYSLRHRKKPT